MRHLPGRWGGGTVGEQARTRDWMLALQGKFFTLSEGSQLRNGHSGAHFTGAEWASYLTKPGGGRMQDWAACDYSDFLNCLLCSGLSDRAEQKTHLRTWTETHGSWGWEAVQLSHLGSLHILRISQQLCYFTPHTPQPWASTQGHSIPSQRESPRQRWGLMLSPQPGPKAPHAGCVPSPVPQPTGNIMDVSPPPEGPSGDTNPSRSEASLSRPCHIGWQSCWFGLLGSWCSWDMPAKPTHASWRLQIRCEHNLARFLLFHSKI